MDHTYLQYTGTTGCGFNTETPVRPSQDITALYSDASVRQSPLSVTTEMVTLRDNTGLEGSAPYSVPFHILLPPLRASS